MKTLQKLSIVSLILILFSFTKPNENRQSPEIRETVNTLEDLIEWIEYDVEGGNIDQKTANTYIYNLDLCIERLNKE